MPRSESLKEAQRKYRKSHPEKNVEITTRCILKNKDEYMQYQRDYHKEKYHWLKFLNNNIYIIERDVFMNILL